MEVESHLDQTVQCADWICGLLGRIAAYKFDPDFEEFRWATKYSGDRLAKVTSDSSKIRVLGDGKDLFPRYLAHFATCYDPARVPASRDSFEALRARCSSQ